VIEITLNSLRLNANRQTLASLFDTMNNVSRRLATSSEPQPSSGGDESLDKSLDTSSLALNVDEHARKFKVTAHIAAVSVVLAKESQALIEMLIENVFLRVSLVFFTAPLLSTDRWIASNHVKSCKGY
jgi:hypothetical protein